MFAGPGGDAGTGVTTCYRHPHKPTGLRCIQCSRPTCADCLVATPRGLMCPDDAATVDMALAPVGSFGQHVVKYPYVTWTVFGLNIVLYLVTAFWRRGTVLDNTDSLLFHRLVLSPVLVGEEHEYYRLISSMFLPAGPVHLVLNLVALGVIGPALERLLGWWRFLAIFGLSAFGATVAVLNFGEPASQAANSSGPILGLFAGALLLYRVVGFDLRSLWITVLINFVITFTVPSVSKLGLVGGFVVGGLCVGSILEWSLERKPPQSRRVRRQTFYLGTIAFALLFWAALRLYDLNASQLIQSG